MVQNTALTFWLGVLSGVVGTFITQAVFYIYHNRKPILEKIKIGILKFKHRISLTIKVYRGTISDLETSELLYCKHLFKREKDVLKKSGWAKGSDIIKFDNLKDMSDWIEKNIKK